MRTDIARIIFHALVIALFCALLACITGEQTVAASPGAENSLDTPAFLDRADQVTLWMERPTTADALTGHVFIHCGTETVPVTQVTGVGDASDTENVVLAGTFQSVLGGSDWNPSGSQTRMRKVAPGVFEFQARLPKGNYRYKVTRGGSWTENYGAGFQPNGHDLPLTVPADNTLVLFQVDFNKRTIRTSLDTPSLTPTRGPTALASHTLRLTLARRLGPTDIVQPMSVQFPDGTSRPVFARDVLSEPEYFYDGDDLGARYSPSETTFKVWSPVASDADLLLYPDATSPATRTIPLHRGNAGVWYGTVPGDLDGTYYQYRFTSYGVRRTAPDIYGHAASADLRRSMVIDLARTNPADWNTLPAPALPHPTDAVVYEIHIRDFTIDASSGVPDDLRGKYLGIVAPGTHVPGSDQPTGIDYLRQLGVTHVHLLPFQSIAPHHAAGYNWGYETDLFNVPEPRYAAHPDDPAGVIREVKTMVLGLHQAHLGLVMDVVYNHAVPVSGNDSPFWATVPYYYFRTNAKGESLNESGVGNAMNDDHPMVRKFICDSLAYWAIQYHVDGFRFDLLGMFTPRTVQTISETLHTIRPDILLYGEPWTGGGPTRFGKGAQRGLGVAVFNDNIRNLVRGDLNGTRPGFALGGRTDRDALQTAISGSPDFAQAPTETMNYVSIHDDRTLWDKIAKSLPDDETLDRQALKLAGAIVILSQGVPILEGGAEMGRTKQGESNSYDLGDAINHFDWNRGLKFADVSDYYQGLIAIRKSHPAFRCATAARVKQTLSFLPISALPAKTVAFTLDGTPSGDSWHTTLVIFHGSTDTATMTLPPGAWRLAFDGIRAKTQGDTLRSPTLPLAPLSAYVLYQDH